MQWGNILNAVSALVKADTRLRDIYGDRMRMTGTGQHVVPLLAWTLISETEGDKWAPVVIQFDQWLEDEQELIASDRRLRQLFHHEGTFVLGGLTCFGIVIDGTLLASPDRDGYIGKALRFQLTPLRERYTI